MKSWKNWAQKQEFKGLIVLPDLVPLEKKIWTLQLLYYVTFVYLAFCTSTYAICLSSASSVNSV